MTVQFAELAKLLGNDQHRAQFVVRQFYHSVAADWLCLEQAAAAHDWQTMREHAQRIHADCLRICELDAADAAATLRFIPDELFADAYTRRRVHIVELLNRAKEFSGCNDPEHCATPDKVAGAAGR